MTRHPGRVRSRESSCLRPGGRVVGEVSVGVSTGRFIILWPGVRKAAILVGLALIIGVVGSVLWRGGGGG